MRITLIRYHDLGNVNTRLPESLNKVRGVLPPLGLAYIAAYLESKGHSISIIDAPAENLNKEQVQARLKEISPTVVGITATTSCLEGALEAASLAKESGALVVIGGPQMSAYPKETLSYSFVDFGIIGDGEVPMTELLEALQYKKDYANVPGLVYKKNGSVIQNEAFVLKDLNALPAPAFHLLPLKQYTSIISSEHMITMISGRGCPYRCGFCFTQPTDKFYRMIDPAKVVDEMEMVVKRYGIKEIMFYDDTIVVNRSHVEGICKEILARGLKVRWESPCRVDTVDKELLALMAKSGCFRLRFGVESGNEEILRLMNKRIKLEQVSRVFQWCKELGMETFAYFIIGYARENEKTMQDTIDFAIRLNPDYVMFTVATPYPFTHLYRLAEEAGLVQGDYWREFTLGKRKDRLPYFVQDSEAWVKKAYQKFYFRPSYIAKKLLSIRSFKGLSNMAQAAEGISFFKMAGK